MWVVRWCLRFGLCVWFVFVLLICWCWTCALVNSVGYVYFFVLYCLLHVSLNFRFGLVWWFMVVIDLLSLLVWYVVCGVVGFGVVYWI